MTSDAPFKTVIVGGGVAALEAILTLRELAPAIEIELLTPKVEYVRRPLSVADPFARPGMRRYSYERFAELGVTVRHDALLSVSPGERCLRTSGGEDVGYDALLVATGARSTGPTPGVLTFGGPDAVEWMHGLVQDLEGGYVRSVVFAVPAGMTWTLPLYELALQTAERADDMNLDDVRVAIVSNETRPLEIFGHAASEKIETLLGEAAISFTTATAIPPADRVVALPVLAGHPFDGLPATADGFLPVDSQGRVDGAAWVWAAGDGSSFSSIKQGGLATQQAEVVARSIAITAGCDIAEGSYDPVLRGILITGRHALHLIRRLDGVDDGQISSSPLWSPPSKIAGKRLAPFLDALDANTTGLDPWSASAAATGVRP